MIRSNSRKITINSTEVAHLPIPRWVFMLAYLAVPVKFLFSLHRSTVIITSLPTYLLTFSMQSRSKGKCNLNHSRNRSVHMNISWQLWFYILLLHIFQSQYKTTTESKPNSMYSDKLNSWKGEKRLANKLKTFLKLYQGKWRKENYSPSHP